MQTIIISDTSCFIILSKINELELLKNTFSKVYTTPEIVSEFNEQLPFWIEIQKVKDLEKQKIIETMVDKGEASAISLAIEIKNALLILDDFKARRLAKDLNIEFIGTIGVIVRAKLKGVIPSVLPLLQKIKQTNFRLPTDIETLALKEAGELL